MRTHRCLSWASVVLLSIPAAVIAGLPATAQTAGTPQSIEQKISAQYTPTKATADHSDIVTAGAVIVLKKDGLVMTSTTSGAAAANVYKDGHITSTGAWKMTRGLAALRNRTGQAAGAGTRTFVAGEKFWLTGIDVRDDGIVLEFMSDQMGDIRYYSSLKFPYAKGAYPSDDVALKSVSEVLDVAPQDNGDQGQQTAGGGQGSASGPAPAAPAPPPAAPAEPAPAPMAAIPPPPPPSDTPPPTITLKETKEQVVAAFGQPKRVVKLGAKEIDYYQDMKVTFMNDKVTDVE
ncbi:MAG: hypothetical protein WBD98_05060 [Acidobacteriaceae bacterium]